MKTLAKMSVKDIIGKVPTHKVNVTDPLTGASEVKVQGIAQHIIRLVGVVVGAKVITTSVGESIAFSGQFEATNVLTGESYRSASLFLPTDAANQLMVKRGMSKSAIEFAFDIHVKPSGGAYGYDYESVPLGETENSNPLVGIAKRLLKDAPALPNQAVAEEKPKAKK
jgi:hypothetical protein